MRLFSLKKTSLLVLALPLLYSCSADTTVVVPPVSSCAIDENSYVVRLNTSSYDNYTYVNLLTGQILDLSAEQAAVSNDWHFAMRRNTVLLNGGLSGPGNTEAAIVDNQDDFYLENGNPDNNVFFNTDCDDHTEEFLADYSVAGLNFSADVFSSAVVLPPADEDSTGFIDYGWYKEHKNDANNRVFNDEWIWLMRGGEGNSYAKFYASSLSYSTQLGLSVSFEFETQLADTKGFNHSAEFVLSNVSDGRYCFDFDTNQNVACSGVSWDLELAVEGLNWVLISNSGISGSGNGGVFGRLTQLTKELYTEAEKDALGNSIKGHYFADKASGVLDEAWYAYNLRAQHKLYPNYRVFMIATDINDANAPYVKLQILSYYDFNAIAAQPLIRFTVVEN